MRGVAKKNPRRSCVVCGRMFVRRVANQKTCSPECKAINDRLAKKVYARALSGKIRAEEKEFRLTVEKVCRGCGRKFRERVKATVDEQVSHSLCHRCRELQRRGAPWEEIIDPKWHEESLGAKRQRKMRARRRAKENGK